MDFDKCPCSGKNLARLVQPAVLAVLAIEPLHGYLIVQHLATMRIFRGQAPDPTGVYRLLKALEREGYVKSTWQMTDNGPAKRCFALTAAGHTCLTQWAQTLEEYEESVVDLLQIIAQAMGPRRRAHKKQTRRNSACSPGAGCCRNASPN